MQQQINELLRQTQETMGEKSDFIIVTHSEGAYCTIIGGKEENIAEAIFTSMHDPDNSASPALYRILKLVVLNTIRNSSSFAHDLIDSLYKNLPENER